MCCVCLVRSYVNELEYVDDAARAAVTESVAEPQMMVEQESEHTAAAAVSTAADSEADAQGNSFHMESDADFAEDDSLGITTMLEMHSAQEVNTDVIRAMALEIHEAAQAALPEDAAIDESFVEVGSEAEAEIDPTLLSPEEVAQAIADAKADAADAAAEKADAVEAAKDAAEAKAAAAPEVSAAPQPAVPAPTAAAAPAAAPAALPAAPNAADPAAALAAAAAAATPAPAAAAPAAAPAAVTPAPIVLPQDLSVENQESLATNEAATFAIRGALGEVGAILSAKDDTIAGLVANVSYMTVSMGRLANQVDLQKSYISLLLKKLAIAQLKNAELANHVALSTSTVASVRAQIGAMESRLNSQDDVTKALAQFLTAQGEGDAPLPDAPTEVEIVGTRTSYRSIRDRFAAKARRAAAVRRAARAAALEKRQKAYALRRAQRLARERTRRAIQRSRRVRRRAAAAAAAAKRNNGPIPTIVVEIPDTGLIEEGSE